MSKLLRSMLVLVIAGLLVVACDQKEEATSEELVPAAVMPAATPEVVAPVNEPMATGGGYEPTAEERVPGITLDPAAPVVEAASASK